MAPVTKITCIDVYVDKDSGYKCFGKTERNVNYYHLVDPERYVVYTPLNFAEVADGPEYVRNALYVSFAPLTANHLDGVFLYICACDMEYIIRSPESGDRDSARMCFGVYRTNAAKKEVFDWIREMECDDCGQWATNCDVVYHCMKCKETYCQTCAKLIPDSASRRVERI